MGIAAGFLMQAISGNMNDTRFLQNFTERIKANGMSPEQIEKLRKAEELKELQGLTLDNIENLPEERKN